MLMRRHHHPESPDYYSSLASAAASAGVTSPSLSLGIISSSLEKLPLELRLRRSNDLLLASGRERAGALDEELSPKTECSEDSVEIRSTPTRIHRKPQIILRPNAVLASSPHSSSLKRPSSSSGGGNNYPPNKMSNWMDPEQPDEKRMRLMAGQQHQQPPPLTHFYHPASAQHQNVLKLAGQHQHPHELLLLEAERNRLFHHWMRPNNWPLPHVHPTAESSAAHHLMTSALHYHYPHLLQQQQQQQHHQGHNNYHLPPHPFLHPSPASAAAAAASIFNLSYGHLLPHPIFHHQRPAAAFFSTPSSDGVDKTLPPLSPVCARSVTPPPTHPSMLGPLPPLVPVGGSQSPRHIGPPPPPPLPDFNHKKMPNASGESSSSPSATSLTIGRKTNKKSAIHPAGRTSQTKESRKHPSDSGCDRKFSANGSKTGDVAKPPVLPLFLSVETLLSREKPAAAPAEKIRPEERFRHAESEEEEEEEEEIHWRSSSSAFRDGPDGFQPSAPSGGASMAGSASHRNYKNMTRERRMQANARERTRVHTISSAFEALRRAVPSFSHGQRLSKLSILRVASAYIAALGQLAGDEDSSTQESSAQIARDEENHQTTTTTTATTATTTGRRQLAECVDRCTRTLMTEGQLLRRNRKRSGVANGRQPSDDEDD